jgi:starch synthase
VYLLHAPGLLDQPGNPYTDATGQPWPDSARRFAWLGWAAARLGTGLDATWQPDVVHGHDWHTGLGAAYLHALAERGQRVPASVFTIHNLAYQGVFGREVMGPLGLRQPVPHAGLVPARCRSKPGKYSQAITRQPHLRPGNHRP